MLEDGLNKIALSIPTKAKLLGGAIVAGLAAPTVYKIYRDVSMLGSFGNIKKTKEQSYQTNELLEQIAVNTAPAQAPYVSAVPQKLIERRL